MIFIRKHCLTDVSVAPEFYTVSDHRPLRARFRFSHQGEKAANLKKRNGRMTFNWDKEKCHRFIHHIRDNGKEAEGLKTTKGRLRKLSSWRFSMEQPERPPTDFELAKLC
ncbi:unnamed protein product [Heligmosomoides polygyrus]|uniref:Endo/exonuclease/phosphatase domain-containing protein n=1 Tax=Heligmosomoides polygyrus TaxID=6339 RepID=A0A183G015_HELPZ|nr:unnamed protein product [Heligmosomoides polygyrus]